MKALIFVLVILILAAITNPGEQRHLNALKQNLRSAYEAYSGEELVSNTEPDSASYVIDEAWVDRMVRPLITVENYIVFSVSRYSLRRDKTSLVGIGVFGIVWKRRIRMSEPVVEKSKFH